MNLQKLRNFSRAAKLGAAGIIMASLLGCGGSPKDHSPKSELIDGINYVGMSVSSLDASTQLYQAPVDMTAIDGTGTTFSFGGQMRPAKTRLLRSVNAQIRLMEFENRPATPPVKVQGPGIAHVAYQVADETGAYEKLLSAGATHIGAREMVGLSAKNPVRYAYIKDNDGIIAEIEQVDVPALNLPEPPKTKYRIRQVSLATPDIDAIVKFYAALLDDPKPRRAGRLMAIGSEKIDAVSGLAGSKLKMAWFQTRNLEIEIFQYTSHPTKRPAAVRPVNALGYNVIVFDMNDVEAVRKKFIDAGGQIQTDIGAIDDGTGFYGRDPDGNLLGFVKSPAASKFSSQNFSGNGM